MFKTLLVHADARPETANRMECAASLADRFDATLLGCGCEMPQLIPVGPFGEASGELVVEMQRLANHNLQAAEIAFKKVVGQRKNAWVAMLSLPDEAIPIAARQADLIVTSRTSRGRRDALRNEDPGLLTIIAGRPVLIAPPDRDYLAAKRIVVCWKDSREARRALSDALPFLQQAQDVLVVEVANRADLMNAQAALSDVAIGLHRHGVEAKTEVLVRDERDVAAILLDRARAFGADLVIAGGYGRTRLGEWAFGGVTLTLLDQDEFFVLLSH